ncbi:glycosyltransferase family 4 protein [Desulfonauticus submarinus]
MIIRYFAKTHIPSYSANSIQVVNMIISLSKQVEKVFLYIPFKPKRLLLSSLKTIFFRYGVKYPKNLKISFLKKDKNFLFEESAINYINKKLQNSTDLFFTRNIFIAYFLTQKNKRVIYESHEFSKDKQFKNFKSFIESINKHKYSKIIAISNSISQKYQKNGLMQQKIKVFPDGINEDFFKKKNKKTKEKYLSKLFKNKGIYNQKIVLYTGSLKKEKGVYFLLKIAQKLPHINFIIVGGRPKEIEEIKNDINSYKNIYIHPYIKYKNIPVLLQEADILVMPYLKKGSLIDSMSPLKMFEYLASGKPILASKLPVIEEILQDNYNSFLFEPENIDSFIKSLKKIFSLSIEDLKYISNNALQTAKQHTWDKRVKNILNWYHKTCV